eukprot:1151196-Pelagomonas_calceolata.AAC.5
MQHHGADFTGVAIASPTTIVRACPNWSTRCTSIQARMCGDLYTSFLHVTAKQSCVLAGKSFLVNRARYPGNLVISAKTMLHHPP